MASYSPLGVPFQLKPTIADFGESFNKGLQYGMEPRKQAESLLSTLLANKQNAVKAKYAEQMEQANLNHILSQNQGLDIANQYMPEKYQQAAELNKLKIKYPGLGSSGVSGQVAFMQYLRDQDKANASQNNDYFSEENAMKRAQQDADRRAAAQEQSKMPWEEIKNNLYQNQTQPNIPFKGMLQDSQGVPLDQLTFDQQTALQHPKSQNQNYIDMIEQSLNKKAPVYQGAARDAYDRQRFRDQFGENSPQVKEMDRIIQQKEAQNQALLDQRHRALGGLKSDEVGIYDENGNLKGINKPYTASEKKVQSGRRHFDYTFKFLNEPINYYSGKGSMNKFEDDISKVNTDPNARERIIRYIVARRLEASTIVKENATIGGANTNKVLDRISKTLHDSDLWPKYESYLRKYKLPYDMNIEAGERFNNILDNATELSSNIPARHVEWVNPEEHKPKLKPISNKKLAGMPNQEEARAELERRRKMREQNG